ncbi:MAG: VWA domain-containing protein [Desulfobacterales bacterium]|nr:VWA domain-containing protein [Desulfobacterales bacterium]
MYEAEISRTNPALILFLFDCSYSMSEKYGSAQMSKGEFLAKLCNESVDQIILSCEKGDEIRAYFEIGIIGYGQGSDILLPVQSIIDLAYNPIKMEKYEIDGIEVERPVWISDPTKRVNTDMIAGFKGAKAVLNDWTAAHMSSFPPVLIHVSDGKWTSGNPLQSAEDIKNNVATSDGQCIVMNIHIGSQTGNTLVFPAKPPTGDEHKGALFQMSSELPDSFYQRALEMYPATQVGARGYMFNAQPDDLTKFFDIGTRLRG